MIHDALILIQMTYHISNMILDTVEEYTCIKNVMYIGQLGIQGMPKNGPILWHLGLVLACFCCFLQVLVDFRRCQNYPFHCILWVSVGFRWVSGIFGRFRWVLGGFCRFRLVSRFVLSLCFGMFGTSKIVVCLLCVLCYGLAHNKLWENFGVMTYRNEINPENPHQWAFPHLVEASLHGG